MTQKEEQQQATPEARAFSLKSRIQELVNICNERITNLYTYGGQEIKDDHEIFKYCFTILFRDTAPLLKRELPDYKKDDNGKEVSIFKLLDMIESWYTLSGYSVAPSDDTHMLHGIRLFDLYVEALTIAKLYSI